MRFNRLSFFCKTSALFLVLLGSQAKAASDLYIRDTATDAGAEPYTGPGPVYLSPDIWVRHDSDPNYDPYPFATVSPPWTPMPHQDPEYRDTKRGLPNYIYVRIHNRGDQPSNGTERLRLYQAKASTGLNWPSQWVDDVGQFCGADRLLGIEVTKPRKNAQTASISERQSYRDALVQIGSDPAFQYADGVSYWHKQSTVHSNANYQHGNPAFFPWHREMMNRLELRLREADPLVTLLYWDFTSNPQTGTTLFDSNFMGNDNGAVNAPLTGLQPPNLSRFTQYTAGNCATFDSDVALMNHADYAPMRSMAEGSPNHNSAHGCIGGAGGQISSASTAAQDPFFFQLHGNVDRQWANWQRDGADPARLDPVATYGTNSSDFTIDDTLAPWDGSSDAPWNGLGAATSKTSKHSSVVFPPIYDTAPLNIPVLQPGESVVIEVPWYPPNVDNYNCAGQAGHFCMLARIETDINAPFGMTFPEIANVGTNTRENNNIAWKNLTVVDDQSDGPAFLLTGTLIRNAFKRDARFEFRLIDRTEKRRFLLPEFAQVGIALPEEIIKRLREGDGKLDDLKFAEAKGRKLPVLQIAGKEPRFSLPLKAGEVFTAELVVNVESDKLPKELLAEPFLFDIEQHVDLPGDFFADRERQALEVGGVRFALDFAGALKDPKEREDLLKVADLKLDLRPVERKMLKLNADRSQNIQHLSVGEPVIVRAVDDEGRAMRKLTLEMDGKEIGSAEKATELTEVASFDEPGVHTLVARGIGEDGQIILRRARVLVSRSIPPDAVILSPGRRATAKAGETVRIVVDAAAAFKREVKQVTMHVKDNDAFATGFDLVRSENFPAIESRDGPGPHSFEFKPEKPGRYMVQFGVTDDTGQVGESGHLMLMITQ